MIFLSAGFKEGKYFIGSSFLIVFSVSESIFFPAIAMTSALAENE